MGDKKRPEDLVREMASFEVTELDDRDLDGVAGGLDEGGTNGNCSICKPGDPVPPGDWTNGNCAGDVEAT